MKIVIIPIIFLLSCSSVQTRSSSSDLLDCFLDWFIGEFNNYEQVETDRQSSSSNPHPHLHFIFAPVRIQGMTEPTLHVQQSHGADLQQIYRLRMYQFYLMPETHTIGMRIFKYRNEKDAVDLHKESGRQKALRPDELIPVNNCEILWEFRNQTFYGHNRQGYCRTYSEKQKQWIVVKDSLVLTSNELWILDHIYDSAGTMISGRTDQIPNRLRKCRFYTGWAFELKNDSSRDYYVFRNLVLHDQGERITLQDSNGYLSPYQIQLASYTYTQTQVPVLKLGLYEGYSQKTKLYIWGEPGAKRLGMNLKYFQTGFTLSDKQRFRPVIPSQVKE